MQLPAINRRRAIQHFARLVDKRHRVRRQTDHVDDADLDIVNRLERLNPDIQPDPDFKANLRLMLMATAERDGIGATAVDNTAAVAPQPGRCSRRRRGVVLAGLTAATVALPVASVIASSGAVPGQPLYDVKRSAEQAQLVMPNSRAGRGQLLLDFAQARATEADKIAGDTQEMATILDQMDAQTREGVSLLTQSAVDRRDQAALDAIDAFQTAQHRTMSEVLTDITGAARTRAVTSMWLLDDVKNRVDALRAYIRCADTAPVQSDELGPKPHPCGGHGTGPVGPADAQKTPVSSTTSTQPTLPANPAPAVQLDITTPSLTVDPTKPTVVIAPTPAPVQSTPAPGPVPTTPPTPTTVKAAPDPQDVADEVEQLLSPADGSE